MNRDFKQMAPLERQADMLASKGRFGDTMLVHMNPTEVDVLRQMTPGGQLTINPDTGQPEAFLPLLLGLAGGFLGGAGALGGLGALTAGAIGTGLGTTIETGSLKEGLKAGLISGLIGGVAGKFLQGAGDVATKGVEKGVTSGATEAITQTAAPVINPATTTGPFMSGIPSNLGQAASQVGTEVATEAVKPSLLKQLTQGGIPQVGTEGAKGFVAQVGTLNPTQNILTGGVAGLTGQAMSDQYNLMNMPIGPGLDEDAEDFYVPVTAEDRGVQFPGARQGTAEFDYFANPFSFTQDPVTPPPSFKEGGMIKGHFRGGLARAQRAADAREAEIDARIQAALDKAGVNPNVNFNMPSYISGQPAQENTENMIEETFRERVYTPRRRMMPQTSMSNIRGAGDVDFVDYNRRLLGAPTREVTRMRQMTEEEIAARDAAAEAEAEAAAPEQSSTPATTATSGVPQQVLDLMPAGSDFSQLPPEVQAQIVAGLRESISIGGEMGAYGGAAFDPTLPASDFSVPATDGSMDSMGGGVGFNPVPSVQTAPSPVMSAPAVSPVTPIPSPLSVGFDPLANVDLGSMGRGGFGGMGGISVGM
tara:strand:+ start:833 stop:2605 length:1773 start_codon:yes stop_codon:yes gene_type:complete